MSKKAADAARLAELDGRAREAFPLTNADLTKIVSFDQRDDRALVEALHARGGVAGVAAELKSSSEGGIPAGDDFELRKHALGENRVPPPPTKGFLMLVWEAFEDTTLRILLAGAAITLTFGMIFEGVSSGWREGVAIFVAVILVVMVTTGNDYFKEKKFQKIFLLASDKFVKVVRAGKEMQISSFDVCVGDIVMLATGDEVPADGIFIEGSNLTVDESALTGESLAVKKSAERPFLFSGCEVTEGSGRMLCTATGVNSSGGQIQQLLNAKQKDDTPLQEKLSTLAVRIGQLGMIAAIATFAALMINWGIRRGNNAWDWGEMVDIVHYFVIGVTVVVLAVPEGLPLAVTIALAFSMMKMIKDRNFVRHLDASETMGEATCICTDKTGTLTENRMTVVQAYMGGVQFSVGSTIDAATKDDLMKNMSSDVFRSMLTEGISTNSSCFIEDMDSPQPAFIGSKTEGALLIFAYKMGVHYNDIRTKHKPLRENQFSSERKRMSVLIGLADGTYRSHVKGAAEMVLSLCTSKMSESGTVASLDEAGRAAALTEITAFASKGLRTICLAYRNYSVLPREDADIESELTFLGIVGIKDPVRPEVPDAVRQCRMAGLVVRMVTGDNVLTAQHIARECGILSNTGICMEGPKFRALSDEEKDKIIPSLQVLARSSPQDKFILVSRLKALGEVVAVTGDGTNDAPALKEADVGFSMGIAGTDIAKTASDIILLDDNFSSIVNAIRWGRNVFESIRKFVQFQLAVNTVAVLLTFVGSVVEGDSPLSAVQLLWVNLIMDTLGALALATDVPRDDILRTAPVRREESVVTKGMFLHIAVIATYQLTALLVILFYGFRWFDTKSNDVVRIHTLVFTTFVLMQIVNEIIARHLFFEVNLFKGMIKNVFFIPLMFVIFGIQIIVVQFGSDFTSTVPLNINEWVGCGIIAVIQLPLFYVCHLPKPPVLEVDVAEHPVSPGRVTDDGTKA